VASAASGGAAGSVLVRLICYVARPYFCIQILCSITPLFLRVSLLINNECKVKYKVQI